MAGTATELERLVVKLMGEGTDYTKMLDAAVKDTEKATKEIDKAAKEAMAANNKAVREATRITQAAATPTENYNQKLKEANRLYKTGMITGKVYQRTIASINKEFGRGVHRVMAYAAGIKNIGRQMRSIGTMLTLAVTLPVTGMVSSFGSFDDAMTKSVAIMAGVTAELRGEMEQTARTIARDSVTSATELARSYYYLASAGLDVKQSIAALPVVEKFAVAGAFDMAMATDLLTDAQSALGLSSKDAAKNMQNMIVVGDVLVKSANLANATVQQFSEALTADAAAAIKTYNMDLEESIAILDVYADKGKKGAEAGNMFGRMTRLLIESINKNREAFDELNIDVEEFASTGKNITAVLEGITKATEGMGPAQTAATLKMLGFRTLAQKSILPLLGAADSIRAYQKALEDAAGATEKVAKKQLTSFIAQMKILWNRVKEVTDEISSYLAPYVRMFADVVSYLTTIWRGLNPAIKQTIALLVGVAAILGPVLVVAGTLVTIIGGVVGAVSTLVSILGTVGLPVIAAVVGALAAWAAIMVTAGATVKYVIDYIWGPGSLTTALVSMLTVAKDWALKFIGFVFNIRENFRILLEWLPNNWSNIFYDMGNLFVKFVANMLHNMGVIITGFVRLWAMWQGYMVSIFIDVFNVDMWEWVKKGLQLAIDAFVAFAAGAWDALKSIFTGGGKAEQLRQLGEQLANDFTTGLASKDILSDMGKVINEQAKLLKSPIEGFKSSITDIPQLKTDLVATVKKVIETTTKPLSTTDIETGINVPKLAPDTGKIKKLFSGAFELGSVEEYQARLKGTNGYNKQLADNTKSTADSTKDAAENTLAIKNKLDRFPVKVMALA